ncbi:hypothetical protein [Sphaerimonospora mesophila]|uniref:hypothetical protein n=1 Tax=Sphaerimonospora mesophila TaxID=37483 RepID=UPI0006E193BD
MGESSVEGIVDLAVDVVLLAVEALRVDAKKNIDAVAGALGDLWGRDTGVQPERDGGVPQVVRPGDQG